VSVITKKILIAGRPGTKKWLQKYGAALTCVRYKYDSEKKRKIKTVELVVEEEPWDIDHNRIPANKLIWLSVKYGEVHVGKLIRAAGGRWDSNKKLWELPYKDAVALGLENRIVTRKEKNV